MAGVSDKKERNAYGILGENLLENLEDWEGDGKMIWMCILGKETVSSELVYFAGFDIINVESLSSVTGELVC